MTPSAESRATRPASDVAVLALGTPGLVALMFMVFMVVPNERTMGFVQRIFYIHVPCAWVCMLAFGVTAWYSVRYLRTRDLDHDRTAAASAEIGMVFWTLVLITGPLWAKPVWGIFWTWDLRLTLTLLLFLVYVSYLLLRSFTEGGDRTARFAAVYGIAGLLVLPLNYFAIDLAGGRALHPENLGRGSLGDGMGWPFLAGVVTTLVAFVHLLARRVEVGGLRHRLAREHAEAEARQGEPAWDT